MKAVKIMTNNKYNEHIEALVKLLNIMELEDNFSLQCLTFYHGFDTNSRWAFLKSVPSAKA